MKKYIILLLSVVSVSLMAKTSVDSKNILKQVSENTDSIHIDNKLIKGDLNFAEINNTVGGKIKKSTTYIKRSKNKRDTIVHYYQKNKAQYVSNIRFSSCTFKDGIKSNDKHKAGDTTISVHSLFSGSLTFENCKFYSEVDLNYVRFKQNVAFINCEFIDKVNLSATFIEGSIMFSNCEFKELTNLENMHIKGDCVLDRNTFYQSLSLKNTIFEKEPQLLKSTYYKILLRNCQLQDEPLYWVFEDDSKYSFLLKKIEYDKSFYGTKITHGKSMIIHTSRSNLGSKSSRKTNFKLWDAKVEIKDEQSGKWIVWGRINWNKKQNTLDVEKAKLKSPDGKVILENQHILIDITKPQDYKIL